MYLSFFLFSEFIRTLQLGACPRQAAAIRPGLSFRIDFFFPASSHWDFHPLETRQGSSCTTLVLVYCKSSQCTASEIFVLTFERRKIFANLWIIFQTPKFVTDF